MADIPKPGLPGIRNKAADALSRHSVGTPSANDASPSVNTASLAAIRTLDNQLSQACMTHGRDTELIKSITWRDVQLATNNDETMLQLYMLIENGTPEKRDKWPEETRQLYRFNDNLSCPDGVMLYRDRVVIPQPIRDKVLASLHSAHHGVSHDFKSRKFIFLAWNDPNNSRDKSSLQRMQQDSPFPTIRTINPTNATSLPIPMYSQ